MSTSRFEAAEALYKNAAAARKAGWEFFGKMLPDSVPMDAALRDRLKKKLLISSCFNWLECSEPRGES